MSLRIALVSYEFPPDTALGGIGTYAQQAATLLAGRGHSVEVFAASHRRSGHFDNGTMAINLVEEMKRTQFAEAIAPVFSKRHSICNFDIVESPEYFADGRQILRSHPKTPHIVKLHTPNQLIRRSGSFFNRHDWLRHNLSQARIMAGALRQGKRPQSYEAYRPSSPPPSELELQERDYVTQCHFIASPSQAMADWAVREWGIDPAKTMVVPNPYAPSNDLINIRPASNRKTVGFFGRLEYRKGVCDLIDAIPEILEAEPDASFRFVGAPLSHPGTRESFDKYILRRLNKVAARITLAGAKSLPEMPAEYDQVDVCVFPSVWENFPYVCLEAMSAAKAIVASNSGGMAEMLDSDGGLLVPPRNPKAIAAAVIRLLQADDLRIRMGFDARRRVLDQYSAENIAPQIEKSYTMAIRISQANSYATALAHE